ncbi:N-acetylmuramoyl-L-alanine amidase [candidate division KSB1 bacterium]|nr:N-acetylmuramoyl-L-alanine amidase [candidate division KSB1 bacterium]
MALENIDRSLRLPDGEYFHSGSPKTGIALHHTVGGSASSSFRWWRDDGHIVGTAYLIARDGTIHEVFDPTAWAWQFGLKWPREQKLKFEKRFIGIEIASEGGLTESDGNLYCFDRIIERTRKDPAEAFDFGKNYRGYQYFDKYAAAQVDSVVSLINDLCEEFTINKQLPRDYLDYFGEKLTDFEGVIGHVNVRTDKSDPAPDDTFWQRIISDCGLQLFDPGEAQEEEVDMLTPQQIKELFDQNASQFVKMERDSGNMVKQLLWDLQAHGNNTYISLRDPVENGSVVFYKLAQGDADLVKVYAEAIGFTSWAENRLEV